MDHVRSAALNFLVPAGCPHYPAPLGQDRRGVAADIEALTPDAIRDHYRRLFRPQGTILSVAGNIEWGPLRDQVEWLFDDWPDKPDVSLAVGERTPGYAHLT